jgi:hypothetical protein
MTYKLQIRSNLRGYRYVATLSKAGKLLHVCAGCRWWENFREARLHYSGTQGHRTWRDDYVAKANLAFHNNGPERQFAFRFEAREILNNLEDRVIRFQKGLKTRRRALRKRQRS